MKILGIHLAKSQLRYAVLEGTIDSPTLVVKDRLVTVDPNNVPALMDWFDTQFRSLLDQHKPDQIAYRLTLDPKKEQLFTSEFPLGILNLHAHQRGLPIAGYTPQSFVGSKLGLKKGLKWGQIYFPHFCFTVNKSVPVFGPRFCKQ